MSSPNLSPHQLGDVEAGRASGDTEVAEKRSITAGTVVNEEPSTDLDVVDWDGPNDPATSLNWSSSKKNLHVVIVSLFYTYCVSRIYPVLPNSTRGSC